MINLAKQNDFVNFNDPFLSYLYKPLKISQIYNTISYIFSDTNQTTEKTNLTNVNKIYDNLANDLPMKILLVEDNLINQKLINKVLEKIGYKIKVVNNGLEAINLLKVQSFDLVFMDIQMPEMDGIEATKYIIANFKQKPKIVAMTANAMDSDKEKYLAIVMDDYIRKPISIENIQRVLIKFGKAINNPV